MLELALSNLHLGKWKLVSQWDAITYVLEWLTLKRLIIPTFGENIKQVELSYFAGESLNWYKLFGEKQLSIIVYYR